MRRSAAGFDLSTWEHAEIARSAREAAALDDGDLRLSAEGLRRYRRPPADTRYPLEYAHYLVGNVRGLTVLDLGCGGGKNTAYLAHRGARVWALDISEALLRTARPRHHRSAGHHETHGLSQSVGPIAPATLAQSAIERQSFSLLSQGTGCARTRHAGQASGLQGSHRRSWQQACLPHLAVTADTHPPVLFLVNSLQEGGTERQTVQLAQEVQERGFPVHLATLDARGVLRPVVAASGLSEVPEYRLRSFHDRQTLRQLRRCAAFMRQHHIALVHTHGFYPNIFGLLAATMAGVPVRIASKRETTGCRTRWQNRAERLAFRLAHVIVANCQAVAAQVASSGVPARRIVTIYTGVSPPRVQPEARGRQEALDLLGLPHDPALSYVTLVANLHLPVKDHATFLRAAQHVRASVPHARFVIAGDGERLAEMRSCARYLGLERDVIFLGHCQRIADLLLVSQVGVLSSVGEGLSNAVLEYMAAGRPVVATDVGGTRELVVDRRTGFLVAPRDDRAMASRIVTLLRDPARAREMGREGQRLVGERFSRAAQLDRIVALYESELRRASRSRWRWPWRRSSVSYNRNHSPRITRHS